MRGREGERRKERARERGREREEERERERGIGASVFSELCENFQRKFICEARLYECF